MTTVYLIRHAEAEGNLYRRIHGHYDSLVTPRGWKQIAALSKRFEDTHFDAVYSSDLTRTRMTASAIYKTHGLSLKTMPELREVSMGVWEDLPWGIVELYEPEQLHCFNYDPERWTTEGSENIYDLRSRFKNAILSIAAAHEGQTVAVVAHGAVIRAFVADILGLSPDNVVDVPHYDNTAVSLLHIDGGEITLEYGGDNSHLSPDLSTFSRQTWWQDVTAHDSNNLWYREFDPESDMELYLSGRACTAVGKVSAWKNHSIYTAFIGTSPAGFVELDLLRGAQDGIGWIEYCWMKEPYRRKGMSIQLIGQAVSVYRKAGRKYLRTFVPSCNEAALKYFRDAGFADIADAGTDNSDGHLLEMKIEVDFT